MDSAAAESTPSVGLSLTRPKATTWVPLVMMTTWTVVVLVAFHPGLLSADPLQMLGQGLSGNYANTNPALLSFIEGLTFRVTGSLWPLLLVQLVILNVGLWSILRTSDRPWLATAVLALFMMLPPVWATEVAIWKDVAFACAMLLAVLALFMERPRIAIALLLLAGTCRLNGLLGALPLLFFATSRFPALRRSWQARLAAIAALSLAAVALPKLVDRLFGAHDDWALGWVLVDDLASIYQVHPEEFAAAVFPETSAADLARLYDPTSSVPLFYGPPPYRGIDLATLPGRREAVAREWTRVVRSCPWTYLHARARRFARLLGLQAGPTHYPFHEQIDPNPYGLSLTTRTLVYRGLAQARNACRDSLLFRGWAWLLLLAAALAVAFKRRGWRSLPFWTAVSGMAYALGYFLIAPAADFRYLFFSLVALFLTVALLLAPRPGEEPKSPA